MAPPLRPTEPIWSHLPTPSPTQLLVLVEKRRPIIAIPRLSMRALTKNRRRAQSVERRAEPRFDIDPHAHRRTWYGSHRGLGAPSGFLRGEVCRPGSSPSGLLAAGGKRLRRTWAPIFSCSLDLKAHEMAHAHEMARIFAAVVGSGRCFWRGRRRGPAVCNSALRSSLMTFLA